jgi:glycine/D-amino acid oxidase-like deaminating enzyme
LDPAAIGDAPVAWFPDEGWLDPVPFAGAMLRAASALGAVVQEGARVAAIEAVAGQVRGVRLQGGSRIAADRVVNCAGRWADAIAEDPGPRIPLAPTTGFLVFTPPVALGVRHVLHTPEMNLRPDGAGRLMLVWNDLADLVALDTPPDPGLAPVREMMAGAARLFPSLTGMAAEAVRIGARPMPQDGLSAIGPMPRTEGYYLAVTHSGVTLAAIIGQLVAEEVAQGRSRPELDSFRPARFFN